MLSNLLKRNIHKISSRLGFNIQRARIRPADRTRLGLKTLPIYIEFIGVPGVVKTTLFRKLMLDNRRNYIDAEIFFLQKSGDYNDQLVESIPFCQYLAENKLRVIADKHYKPTDKLKVLNYFYSIMMKDALIYSCNKWNTIISDEGLLHNFSNSVQELYRKDEDMFVSLLRGRSIVYCYASAETATKRILKRHEKTGYLLPQFKVDSENELLEIQQRSLLNKWKFSQLLKEYIPVLLINTEDDWNENKEKINQFIKELQNN